MSSCLYQATGRRSIILIDEYDVPLENAYFGGFYHDMLTFIRSLFESALKTNPSLEFAVITGCLRISKESIFTGLNNLAIYSILSRNYDEFFGFTQKEVIGTGYDLPHNGNSQCGNPLCVSVFHSGMVYTEGKADGFNVMEKKCALALGQIEEKRYAAELEAEGYGMIRKYGICFCRKSCVVRIAEK